MTLLSALTSFTIQSAEPKGLDGAKGFPKIGAIERHDRRLDSVLAADAKIEKLAEGFEWSEGPAWNHSGRFLVFSDIPRNTIFKWSEANGLEIFLKPSGYTGTLSRGGELGSNGLTYSSSGHLIICMHGDRRIAKLETDESLTTLAEYYHSRRLNSPNDLIYKSNGDLYFTDPPYGLEGNVNDPAKELPFQGVYMKRLNGEVILLTDELTRPNGIGFSPDEKILYVANSDPQKAYWMAYDIKANGTLSNARILFDATALVRQKKKGLPDGLCVDRNGIIWATGPGGVLILTASGEHLGTISSGEATANCAFGNDGSTLYMTSDMYLCRIETLTKGLGF